MRNDMTRREFAAHASKAAGAYVALPYLSAYGADDARLSVNDIHSQLNETKVRAIHKPASAEQLVRIMTEASSQGRNLSIAGKRHAMGGQQFGTDTDLVDMTSLDRIIGFDRQRGILEVEAGAMWPAIIAYCWKEQVNDPKPWGIAQKQTGADALTLGGALAANVHGRGLAMRPFIQDVESFKLVTPAGQEIECSRSQNGELFRLVAGGYGLFGVVSSIKLRLVPRTQLRRTVEIIDVGELASAFEQRIAQGYMYGDFQYMTDSSSPDFMKKGVFSCYLLVADNGGPASSGQRELSADDWKALYRLAFTNKGGAYDAYSRYYLSTNGQLYWSDTHQESVYLDDYHVQLHKELGFKDTASLMISELYVPRRHLADFMRDARTLALKDELDIIYGTVRLIRKDEESYLAWAKEDYACVIFNLRVFHTPDGIEKAKRNFRGLIDVAIGHGGSYYLTYHRWAEKQQVLACYPQLPGFLKLKQTFDPKEVIQSDWYRHYKALML